MRTVVIVDDDADDVEFFIAAIKEVAPATITHVYGDCEEALDALHRADINPDVIFLDINMPKMTGDVCLKSLREQLRFSEVKIAMVSTSMEYAMRKKLLDWGANFALWKPYRLDEYAKLVRLVLD